MKNKNRRAGLYGLVLGLICGVVGPVVPLACAEPPRVALLATMLNADSEKFLDLALAELTQRGGIELVERQAIRQVLGEQAQALQQDASGVAAGKLLRADVVGVLETTPDGKEAGGFAVLDTATGVSYWNQAIDSKSTEEVAGEIVKGVAAALEKRSRAGGLSTVCMLGARNAEFPRSLDVFCETVVYLLDRQMVANPSVTTLDRRRLDTVISENNLPGLESKKGSLLPSLRLVELDFRQGSATNEVKVLARVTDAVGQFVVQPEVSGPKDAAELAIRLQAALAEVLHAAPQAAEDNRAKEANRFRAQGRILRNRGLREQEIQAFHAAYALDPGNREQLVEYANGLLGYAKHLVERGEYASAIDHMQRTLDLEDLHQVRHSGMAERGQDGMLAPLMACKKNISVDSPLWREFDALRLRYLAVLGLTGVPGAPAGLVSRPGSATFVDAVPVFYQTTYSEQLRFPMDAALMLSLNPDEFFRLLDGRLGPWLDREADPEQPHDAGVIVTLHDLGGRAYRYIWDDAGYPPYEGAYAQGLRTVAAKFQAHPRQIVRLEGKYLEYQVDRELAERNDGSLPLETMKTFAREMIDEAVAAAVRPDVPQGDIRYLYEMAARGAMSLDFYRQGRGRSVADSADCHAELYRLSERMFDNRHLAGPVLKSLLQNNDLDYERYRLPALRRLRDAQDDPSFVRLILNRKEADELLAALPSEVPSIRFANAPAPVLWATDLPAGWWEQRLVAAIQGEQWLYVCALPDPFVGSMVDRGSIGVLRVDLSTGRSEAVGEFEARTFVSDRFPDSAGWRNSCVSRFISDAACSSQRVWISTFADGLFGVPLDGQGETVRLGAADGLPSDVIHSVAAVGDLLYLGCGSFGVDGYLAAYNPASKICQVLASTLRASPETPLDSLQGGFRILKIVHDEPRKRLLLMVDNGDLQPATGLWEYRLEDGLFRQILSIDRPAQKSEVVGDGKLWIYPESCNEWRPVREKGGWFGGIEFDPSRDFARLAFVNKKKQAGYYLPVLSTTLVYADMYRSGTAMVDGWFYHFGVDTASEGTGGTKLRRISLVTKEVQNIQAVSVRASVSRFGWLRWLPQKRVLIVNDGRQISAVKIGD